MANPNTNRTILILVAIVLTGVVLYGLLTMPDQRTTGQRVGDAVDALERGEGPGEAVEQLERRTPGEKMGDAIEDATDNQ